MFLSTELCLYEQVSELAGHAALMLDQHAKIKRTPMMAGTAQNKRLKRNPPTGHAIQPS